MNNFVLKSEDKIKEHNAIMSIGIFPKIDGRYLTHRKNKQIKPPSQSPSAHPPPPLNLNQIKIRLQKELRHMQSQSQNTTPNPTVKKHRKIHTVELSQMLKKTCLPSKKNNIWLFERRLRKGRAKTQENESMVSFDPQLSVSPPFKRQKTAVSPTAKQHLQHSEPLKIKFNQFEEKQQFERQWPRQSVSLKAQKLKKVCYLIRDDNLKYSKGRQVSLAKNEVCKEGQIGGTRMQIDLIGLQMQQETVRFSNDLSISRWE